MTASLARMLWLLAALLAVAVAAELVVPNQSTVDAGVPPLLPRGALAARDLPGTPAAQYAAVTLQRPLFTPGRRPEAPGGAAAPLAPLRQEPPRLAGIMMTAAGRSAIFATADETGHGTVVGEGGSIGPWRVEAIHAGDVRLAGPDGSRVVRPAFSNTPASTGVTGPGLPGPAFGGNVLPPLAQPDTRPLNLLPPNLGAANFLNAPALPAARTAP